MLACANENGVCMLDFSDKSTLSEKLRQLSDYFQANIVEGDHHYLKTLELELYEYFKGNLKRFSVPVSLSGTVFQQNAWEALRQIPFAAVCSYREQAQAMGKPSAVRAVANANGFNKICIIIPCHRVVGSNGKLTGYSGGLWRKQKLLELEASLVRGSIENFLNTTVN